MTDKSLLRKINQLLKDIQRNGHDGIGKPEGLKHSKAWSSRINREHRLVYIISDNSDIHILSLKGYYEQ